MSRYLYDLGIKAYQLGANLYAPFNQKAKCWKAGRKDVWADIDAHVQSQNNIWMHCASVGEFEQGIPVLEKLKIAYPNKKIILTFFSPSGYEARKNTPYADHVFYLPVDTAENAKRFLDLIQADVALFVKYEFWYHYLCELKKRDIPTFLVAGIFREDHWFFKSYGQFFQKALDAFTQFLVQDENSRQLLNQHGYENVVLTGDTRLDRVYDRSHVVKDLPLIASFVKNNSVLVAGSTWPADEKLLASIISQAEANWKYIIVPHEIHESELKRLEKEISLSTIRYSHLSAESMDNIPVLIVDQMGILFSIYQYADIAYVGGGFGSGIHNTMEPAAFGVPIIFGPKYQKFKEAFDLIQKEAGFSITDAESLHKTFNALREFAIRKKAGEQAAKYVAQNKGAVDLSLTHIKATLSK